MPLPTLFHLVRDGEVLAILEACEVSEMFWQTCVFKPMPGFEEIEPLIRGASTAVHGEHEPDIFGKNYQQLTDMGVRLLEVANNILIETYIIHIHDTGDKVELRFAPPSWDIYTK